MRKRLTALLALVVLASGSPAFALGWPDAIQALAKEKSKAAACVALLKSAGDKKAIMEGQLVYIDAKATSDGAIAGLKTLVAERGKPGDLPKLAESLDTSAAGLQKVCDAARSAAEAAAGARARSPTSSRRRSARSSMRSSPRSAQFTAIGWTCRRSNRRNFAKRCRTLFGRISDARRRTARARVAIVLKGRNGNGWDGNALQKNRKAS